MNLNGIDFSTDLSEIDFSLYDIKYGPIYCKSATVYPQLSLIFMYSVQNQYPFSQDYYYFVSEENPGMIVSLKENSRTGAVSMAIKHAGNLYKLCEELWYLNLNDTRNCGI